ncbi:MAG: DNA-binding protein, partial [Oscillospiraceae bacterium]
MQQYYNDDLSLSEIAENFSITRQGVRDSIKRGEGTILELEQKIGFAKRYRAVQEGIAELEHLTREINFINGNNYNTSEEIKKATDNMLAIISQISDIEDSEA